MLGLDGFVVPGLLEGSLLLGLDGLVLPGLLDGSLLLGLDGLAVPGLLDGNRLLLPGRRLPGEGLLMIDVPGLLLISRVVTPRWLLYRLIRLGREAA